MMLTRQLGSKSTATRVRHLGTLLQNDGFINGEWTKSRDGKTFAVVDPGTGKSITDVADLDVADCERAIGAAHQAMNHWKNITAKERGGYLRKIYDLHIQHADELAEILAMESGKPIAEAKGEIIYGASYFEWFAEEAKRLYGDIIPAPVNGRTIMAVREPVGVCGLLTPFNFPNAMISRKAAAALAAGCTVVIRPSNDTPLSTLAIAAMAESAGVPPGVFNVVTSHDPVEVVGAMTEDDRVRKISFTGSTRVGRLLIKQCADTVKKVSMELGGNAPFIVFNDADLEAAADGFMASKYRNAGQTCVCANRIFVQSGVYDKFAKIIADRLASVKVGKYNEPGVTIGPLINNAALQKVSGIVDDAVKKNAKVILGGHRLEDKGDLFYAPTILTGCTSEMRVAEEEIFGPIAPLFKFETEEEVIRKANDTEVGLASYFFTTDLGRAFRVARALETGMVGVNTGIISTEVAPFGGVKQSGLGREGSKYGLDDYTEIKYIALQTS